MTLKVKQNQVCCIESLRLTELSTKIANHPWQPEPMSGWLQWVSFFQEMHREGVEGFGEVASQSSFVSITLGKDTRRQGDSSGSAATPQAVRKGSWGISWE